MSAPLLTLAIPTYNRAIWLDQSLEIIRQELEQLELPVEVLISNNASTDNTADIISFHQQYSAFTVFDQAENIGAVRNIMFLTKQARGQFLWVLGDDDFLYKGFLQKLLQIIAQNHDVPFYFIEMRIWNPIGPVLNKEDLDLIEYNRINYTSEPLKYSRYSEAATIANPARGYFNAIGNIILRTSDYAKAFEDSLSAGPEFTSIETTFPHAYYIAHNLLKQPCISVESPGTYCSHTVSWRRYYEITHLKWYPELFMLMAAHGANQQAADYGRRTLFTGYIEMIPKTLLGKVGNAKHFSLYTFIKNNYKFPEFWRLPYWISRKYLKSLLKKE